jgi:hypothetical protein
MNNYQKRLIAAQRRRRNVAKAKVKYFIAVVVKSTYRGPDSTVGQSGRSNGEWAAFIGNTEDEAKQLAEDAARQWDRQMNHHSNAYQIIVGPATKRYAPPSAGYEEVEL